VIKLLVVDDSALLRRLIGQVFSSEPDFEVAFARSGSEALDALTSFGPDVVTLDVQMPEMDGLTCLDRIMVERPCPVVMVSSLTASGAEATLEAFHLGAVDFVAKPSGAVSLHMDAWGPELLAKIRAAAAVKMRSSRRLKDRVRHRIGGRSAPAPDSPPEQSRPTGPVPAGDGLVLVGVSTGGPPALEALLTALPARFAWPILIAQHMPASFTGPLARRLNALCALDVQEVVKPTALKAGGVYIGRGDADLIVTRRHAGLVALAAPPLAGYPWSPSTDRLVRTAMACLPPFRLVGVLMTGMGNDGAEAMAQLRASGGATIAEAEETAVVWGMPGELVKAGGADWIEPLPKIAARLRSLVC
jgi:two-component system chemotaxis response regulator CheB